MEKKFRSASSSDLNRDVVASVMTSLEPDQLIAAKAQYHCPRRQLTPIEQFLFWALRLYLVFMLAIVLYQVFAGAR
ncbi:MAG TPA: hypothetical protein VFO39_05440 [Candidatus Sulfotelmatobacter sp.]|nr:hypothetical protein [Candidatus Sulfotelmatobacter sp.]